MINVIAASKLDFVFWLHTCALYMNKCFSDIAEIDDRLHGTNHHHTITNIAFDIFKISERQTDQPTDKVTYKDDNPSSEI